MHQHTQCTKMLQDQALSWDVTFSQNAHPEPYIKHPAQQHPLPEAMIDPHSSVFSIGYTTPCNQNLFISPAGRENFNTYLESAPKCIIHMSDCCRFSRVFAGCRGCCESWSGIWGRSCSARNDLQQQKDGQLGGCSNREGAQWTCWPNGVYHASRASLTLLPTKSKRPSLQCRWKSSLVSLSCWACRYAFRSEAGSAMTKRFRYTSQYHAGGAACRAISFHCMISISHVRMCHCLPYYFIINRITCQGHWLEHQKTHELAE